MKYHVEFDLDFKRNKLPGKFIVLEGIDASGKTTQAKLVTEELRKRGYDAVQRKEPTDLVIGKFIKKEILSGKLKIAPAAIQYVFAADRAMHQEEIEADLKKGRIVITDRYFWSAICYGLTDVKRSASFYVTAMSALSMYNQFLNPDTTFFLEISIKDAVKRIGKSSKHTEIYDNEEKLKKIKRAYDQMKKHFTKEFTVIDASKDVDSVTQDLVKKIERIAKK